VTATVVADASPLIALQQIGQLELLHALFGDVVVPPAVVREIQPSLAPRPSWIVERPLGQPAVPLVLRGTLGAGESEALSLALETSAAWLLVDDRAARRVAVTLGVRGADDTGRLLQVVFVLDEDGSVYVIHARPLTDPERRRYRRRSR